MNPQKIQSPGTALEFLEVVWLDKIHTIPEAITDKVQAYLIPKTMRGTGLCRDSGIMVNIHTLLSAMPLPRLLYEVNGMMTHSRVQWLPVFKDATTSRPTEYTDPPKAPAPISTLAL